MKGLSIARRILLSFVLLALGLGLTLGLTGHFSYEALGRYLVEVHTRPVMQALIDAEQRAWLAEDRGSRDIYYGSDLADSMHWQFLVGKQIPAHWAAMPDGLHFLPPRNDFVLLVRQGDVRYALRGATGPWQALKARFGGILLFCGLAGLVVAVILALVLARRLTRPLSRLTAHARQEVGQSRCALRPVPQDLCALSDETGVLARALVSREAALQRYVQRETAFTGDVSHELRTPLTVLQSGLEVLEMRLERAAAQDTKQDSAQERAALLPLVRRLLRSTGGMTATVHSLLLLARNPEELVREAVDMAGLVEALLAEGQSNGLWRVQSVGGGQAVDALQQVRMERGEVDTATATPEISYERGALPVVQGRTELAQIVVKNLLDNACRYTENGKVLLQTCATGLTVCNKGRIAGGLDIFARGVRGPQQGQGSEGCGLGLSLALRACEYLGWRLEYRTEAQDMTCFLLIFPHVAHEEKA